jgi:hypothetical protein
LDYLNYTPIAGGAELRFAHLTPYDVFGDPATPGTNGYVPHERKRQKAALVANFEEWIRPELPPEDQLREKLRLVREFDREQFNRLDTFLEWLKRPESQAQKTLLAQSWQKANPGDAMPEIDDADRDAIFWQLVAPFGIRQAEPDEPDAVGKVKPVDTSTYGDGGAPANPTAPLTYPVTEPGTISGTTTDLTPPVPADPNVTGGAISA